MEMMKMTREYQNINILNLRSFILSYFFSMHVF